MGTCESCGNETDDLKPPPSSRYRRGYSEELLCEECREPCTCKGGYAANCTCDLEYETARDRRFDYD